MTTLPEYPPSTCVYKKDNRIIIFSSDTNQEMVNVVVSHVTKNDPVKDTQIAAKMAKDKAKDKANDKANDSTDSTSQSAKKEPEVPTELFHVSDNTAETSITSKNVDNVEYVMTSTTLYFAADDAEAIADYLMEVARMISEKFVWPKKQAENIGPKIPYIH